MSEAQKARIQFRRLGAWEAGANPYTSLSDTSNLYAAYFHATTSAISALRQPCAAPACQPTPPPTPTPGPPESPSPATHAVLLPMTNANPNPKPNANPNPNPNLLLVVA